MKEYRSHDDFLADFLENDAFYDKVHYGLSTGNTKWSI